MNVLVEHFARDGRPGLAPGSVTPRADVPVLLEFSPDRVVGRADVLVDTVGVWARLDLVLPPERVAGLYPALGGVLRRAVGASVLDFDVLAVSLCCQPNADPTIPPL